MGEIISSLRNLLEFKSIDFDRFKSVGPFYNINPWLLQSYRNLAAYWRKMAHKRISSSWSLLATIATHWLPVKRPFTLSVIFFLAPCLVAFGSCLITSMKSIILVSDLCWRLSLFYTVTLNVSHSICLGSFLSLFFAIFFILFRYYKQ